MWVVTENGTARNLAQAYKIEFAEHKGDIKVYATFPICTGKNTADPAFVESATLKTFETENDARNYIEEIVKRINIASIQRQCFKI